jgi:NTE family protein
MRLCKSEGVVAILLASFVFSPLCARAEKLSTENPAINSSVPANRPASEISPLPSVSSAGKAEFTKAHPRLVLALSGGANKSVAEIGVLRSLEKHHIVIDAIIGTSMGSTIGALYCAGMPVDDIEKLFLDRTIHKALLSGVILGIVTRPVTHFVESVTFIGRPYAGITSGTGYRKFLAKNLPATFDQLKIPFAAVVTNLTDGQTTVLAKGNLPEAVFASNCVPTILRPVMIDKKLYVDGGLKANLPSNLAQSMGADIVVAVLVDTAVKPVPNKTFKSKAALEKRVVDVMLASSDKIQARSSDVLIYPDVDFLPVLTKDRALMKRAITAGEKAADSAVPKITTDLLALDTGNKEPVKKDSVDATAVTR